MSDSQFSSGRSLAHQLTEEDAARIQAQFFAQVYGWMAAGLALTGGVSLLVASSPELIQLIFGNRILFFALIIAELALVGFLTARADSWSRGAVQASFLSYAVLNGLTLSVIFLVYTAGSIASTFFTAAIMFGVMSAFGYFTRSDLSGWGKLLGMALIGLVIAVVVNLFWTNNILNLIISFVGVILFTALAAYDTQKLKAIALEKAMGSEDASAKASILGALTLYLDFINLFLFLLRFFGQRR
ncbi:Bax inhibitor-1/YccA family protein [Hymenobacter sp. RP-2-7]|uniref:Bax inhibitor-1/YccA family protein n=1 Tax=Hymenobacter polaris TaxID=2682546 RepID=A0A7Y0AFY0_9BACT|nr:Bax inhibitor-1/YccA family protein [Hymenobacter polaris]NML66607.1 Bax inhibitor-1/YccA family protein [Hymenobacter polaris]